MGESGSSCEEFLDSKQFDLGPGEQPVCCQGCKFGLISASWFKPAAGAGLV